MTFESALILGATGPTGRYLARELETRGLRVVVASRSSTHLEETFGDSGFERRVADALEPRSLEAALSGVDVVIDCIGLPLDRIELYPTTARNLAAAVERTGQRCLQVSSFWAYLPIQHLPLDESHPRTGGVRPVRLRREAEDILEAAGAAVAHLPDFFGPEVHSSSLQQPLAELAAGRSASWIGSPSIEREYVFIEDAMKAIATLMQHEGAYGERWIVPGGGPISGRRVTEIAESHLGRPARVRGAGPWLLRLAALFNRPLRTFLPVTADYSKAITYDGSKLRALVGDVPSTPYEEAIPRTLDWLRAS